MNSRLKLIIIVIAGVFLVVIGIAIYSLLNPKGQLIVHVAPEEGTLLVNDRRQTVKNGQSVSLSPGEYSVSFLRDEFSGVTTQTITIKANAETSAVFVLTPLTSAAEKLMQTDGAQQVIERYKGAQSAQKSKEIVLQNPILQILPITARLYTIHSCVSQKYPDDPTKIALCAAMSQPGLEPYIRKDVQSRGFNPDEFEIIYSTPNYSPDI